MSEVPASSEVKQNKTQQDNIIWSLLVAHTRWTKASEPIKPKVRNHFLELVRFGIFPPKQYEKFLGSIKRRDGSDDPEKLFEEIEHPLKNPQSQRDLMKTILVHLCGKSIKDRDSSTPNDIEIFLKSRVGQSVIVFEAEMEKVLEFAERNGGSKQKAEFTEARNKFGKIVFGKQWDYLQQVRLLEEEALGGSGGEQIIISEYSQRPVAEDVEFIKRNFILKAWGGEDTWAKQDAERLSITYLESLKKYSETHVDISLARRNLLQVALAGHIDGDFIDKLNMQSGLAFRRGLMMKIYGNNPVLAKEMAKRRVSVGHGTGSASLIGFLKYGLRPQAALTEAGQVIAGGEGVWGAANLNQESLSTADWDAYAEDPSIADYVKGSFPIDEDYLHKKILSLQGLLEDPDLLRGDFNLNSAGQTAMGSYRQSHRFTLENAKQTLDYLQKKHKTPEEELEAQLMRLNYPMLYLMPQGSKGVTPLYGGFDAERAIIDGFAREEVPLVLVPKERVALTEKIAKDYNCEIKVFPLEDYPLRE